MRFSFEELVHADDVNNDDVIVRLRQRMDAGARAVSSGSTFVEEALEPYVVKIRGSDGQEQVIDNDEARQWRVLRRTYR